jgi:hypothetical protein
MNKEIIANHIVDEQRRNTFLSGNVDPKRNGFIISNLIFSEVKDYNWNDGNIYTFSNCTVDCEINFQNDELCFEDNCVYKGNVRIANRGVGLDDVVLISGLNASDLSSISIESTDIQIYDSNFKCAGSIILYGHTVNIDKCNMESPKIIIMHNHECKITDSSLMGLRKVNNQNLGISDSYLNGRFVEQFGDDVSDIGDEEKESQK